MSKIYKQDNMTIHNADCMEVMKRYPDNYFDLAVCDPQYGIGESGSKCKSCNSDKVHKEEVTKDMITFKCMDCNFRQHFEKPFGGVSK